jgi:hypothetical protein
VTVREKQSLWNNRDLSPITIPLLHVDMQGITDFSAILTATECTLKLGAMTPEKALDP